MEANPPCGPSGGKPCRRGERLCLQTLPAGALSISPVGSSVSPAGVGSAQRGGVGARATRAEQLAEQLAQSNLRRATCIEQLAQSAPSATCAERLALRRATCKERLRGPLGPLAQSSLAEAARKKQTAESPGGPRPSARFEQLAQSNLRRATCAEQIALRRAISKSACASRR